MNTLDTSHEVPGNGGARGASDTGGTHHPLAQFPHVWNYWLGGTDNSAVDQAVGNEIASILPSIQAQARAGQSFWDRLVRHLAAERAIRQFLDIGITFPLGDCTHEVAQRVAPDCRITYAGHDPVLLAQARALLTSAPEGTCGYVHADVREPGKILHAAGETLDLTKPVALLLVGVLHQIPDDDEAAWVVGQLVAALAPASYVAISHLTSQIHGRASTRAWQYWNEHGTPQVILRGPAQLATFFHGLELLEPGVVSCSVWRPDFNRWSLRAKADEFCGLARKPGSPR